MLLILRLLWCLPQDDVETLIQRLDEPEIAVRDEATLRLIELGESVVDELRRRLEGAEGEQADRLREILDSPYRGLKRGEIGPIRKLEEQYDSLRKAMTESDLSGVHGPAHRMKEDRERELWSLLEKFPRYRGAGRRLLDAIDRVYLARHANKYHGWAWHRPYFDCGKAVALSERILRDHAELEGEALWVQAYCHRIATLDATGHPDCASVRAQAQWKPDLEKARSCLRKLAASGGRYAERARALLDGGISEISVPFGAGSPESDPAPRSGLFEAK